MPCAFLVPGSRRETLAALGAGLALADRVERGNTEAPVTAGALGPPVAQPDALAQLLGGDRVLAAKHVRVERSGQIEPDAAGVRRGGSTDSKGIRG